MNGAYFDIATPKLLGIATLVNGAYFDIAISKLFTLQAQARGALRSGGSVFPPRVARGYARGKGEGGARGKGDENY